MNVIKSYLVIPALQELQRIQKSSPWIGLISVGFGYAECWDFACAATGPLEESVLVQRYLWEASKERGEEMRNAAWDSGYVKLMVEHRKAVNAHGQKYAMTF